MYGGILQNRNITIGVFSIAANDRTSGTKVGGKRALLSVGSGRVISILSCQFCRMGHGLALRITSRSGGIHAVRVAGKRCRRVNLRFRACLVSGRRSYHGGYVFYFVSRLPGKVHRSLCFGSSSDQLSFLFNGCVALAGVARRRVSQVVGVRVDPVGISIRAAGPRLHYGVVGGHFTNSALGCLGHFTSTKVALGYRVISYPKVGSNSRLIEALASLRGLNIGVATVIPIKLAHCHRGLCPLIPCGGRATKRAVSVVRGVNSRYIGGRNEQVFFPNSRFCLLTRERVPSPRFCRSFSTLRSKVNVVTCLASSIN